jgi:hypothetical protein
MKGVSFVLVWMLAAVAGAAPDALSVGGARQVTAVTNVTALQNLPTWAHLATAMATSGTYTLAPGFSMDGYSGTRIELTQGIDVTVLGQGAVLDASNKGKFFSIDSGASLTLKDLTLQHGHMVSGCRSMRRLLAFAARASTRRRAWCSRGRL